MNLTVLSTEIRQLDGLFSLNDLHNAAGGEVKHAPTNFIRLDQTQALIDELCSAEMQITPVKTVRGNRADKAQQGTYVCRELVLAYGMWISPKFNLAVIRAFDANSQASARPIRQDDTPTMIGRRWLIWIDDDGQEQIKPVPPEAAVMSIQQLLHHLNDPNGTYLSTEVLVRFLNATAQRLQCRFDEVAA